MKPENFIIILNGKSTTSSTYVEISALFDDIGIPRYYWPGNFTANTKMVESYKILNETVPPDYNRLIYHTDIDEIPDQFLFKKALKEVRQGKCDVIGGTWKDRASLDGTLSAINIHDDISLDMQFPLRCSISKNIVKGGMTRKTFIYRYANIIASMHLNQSSQKLD